MMVLKTMEPKYNRLIADFYGGTAVIGCGHDGHKASCAADRAEHKLAVLHADNEEFYTFDRFNSNADCVTDICEPLPHVFYQRFRFILLEYLDCYSYNDDGPCSLMPNNNGIRGRTGFQNMLDITQDDGFILILGCPRIKNFRQTIFMHQLQYLELDPGPDSQCVLIPKNQTASIEEIRTQLTSFPPKITKMLQDAVSYSHRDLRIEEILFCEEPYQRMPAQREDLAVGQINLLERFKKAMREENQYFLDTVQSAVEANSSRGITSARF